MHKGFYDDWACAGASGDASSSESQQRLPLGVRIARAPSYRCLLQPMLHAFHASVHRTIYFRCMGSSSSRDVEYVKDPVPRHARTGGLAAHAQYATALGKYVTIARTRVAARSGTSTFTHK